MEPIDNESKDEHSPAPPGAGEFASRFPVVETKVNAVEAGLSAVQTKVGDVEIGLATVVSRLSHVESRLTKVETRLGFVETRLAAVESSIKDVEARLKTVERDLAIVLATYVTKADLKEAMCSMTWRFISILTLYTGGVYYIARYVH